MDSYEFLRQPVEMQDQILNLMDIGRLAAVYNDISQIKRVYPDETEYIDNILGRIRLRADLFFTSRDDLVSLNRLQDVRWLLENHPHLNDMFAATLSLAVFNNYVEMADLLYNNNIRNLSYEEILSLEELSFTLSPDMLDWLFNHGYIRQRYAI